MSNSNSKSKQNREHSKAESKSKTPQGTNSKGENCGRHEAKSEIKDEPVDPVKFMGLPQNNSFTRNPVTLDKLPSDPAVKEAKDWVDYNIK